MSSGWRGRGNGGTAGSSGRGGMGNGRSPSAERTGETSEKELQGALLKSPGTSAPSGSSQGKVARVRDTYAVTPAAGPMRGVWDNEMLDLGTRSLPSSPVIGAAQSARLMPLRTPQFGAQRGSLGRKSAPNSPFAAGMQGEMLDMFHEGGVGAWADDIPADLATPPLTRATPPFLATNPMQMLRMGVDPGTVNPEMMRLMAMNMNQEFNSDIGRRMGGMHHHHHHHHYHHHHHHRGDRGEEMVKLQVNPRATLEVPRSHLRFTARAETHLRNHGHVGWCQRHHNTGTCSFGQGCAFAHVVDSMIEYYRHDSEAALQENMMGGGKGMRHMNMHHHHHHHGHHHHHHHHHHHQHHQHQQQQHQPMPPRGGRPPPLAGLSGMAWHPTSKQKEEEQTAGRSMWGPTKSQKEEDMTLASILTLQKPTKPMSTLSSSATPFTRPARYWAPQKAMAPENSVFVNLHEAVTDAIAEVLKLVDDAEPIGAAQDRAIDELSPTASWSQSSSWLRKQPWGAPAAVAMDLNVAAGLHERPCEVLSGKTKRIIRSVVKGKIRHVDLSLSAKEVNRQTPKDRGYAIAAEFKAQVDELAEVETVSLNHCQLMGDSIAAIGAALPPRVELVEMCWISGNDTWAGFQKLVNHLRARCQSSMLKVSVSSYEEAKDLAAALKKVNMQHVAPLVEIEVKCLESLGHEGRELLCNIDIPGLKLRVPTMVIPPIKTLTAPRPEELRVLCEDLSIVNAATVSNFLSSPESSNVNRVFFRSITAAAAPLLGECIHIVLSNSNIVSLELQIHRGTDVDKEQSKNSLRAVLAVLASQAMRSGATTSLQNLLIDVNDAPEPELLDVCLLLPVKRVLVTANCDRNQLEKVLPPFVDKIKKMSPEKLQTMMIDYGRGFGREHGMCRIKGPWEKCHMEWVAEDEADEAAEELLEPASNLKTENRLPGRFSSLRVAAEVLSKPLAEPPIPDAVRSTSQTELNDALNEFAKAKNPIKRVCTVHTEAAVDISGIDVEEVTGVEFAGVEVTVPKGRTLSGCVLVDCKVHLEGSLAGCTLMHCTIDGEGTLEECRVISKGPASVKGNNNLVLVTDVQKNTPVPPRENGNVFVPVPSADLAWHSPSLYFKKEKTKNTHVALTQARTLGAHRLIAFADMAAEISKTTPAVVQPIAFGCDAQGESIWVVFRILGPELSSADSPSGNATASGEGVRKVLTALHEREFVHGAVKPENIYATSKAWYLGPPTLEEAGAAAKDLSQLDAVVASRTPK